MYGWMYKCMDGCIYRCMDGCIYRCMYGCIYRSISMIPTHIYTRTHARTHAHKHTHTRRPLLKVAPRFRHLQLQPPERLPRNPELIIHRVMLGGHLRQLRLARLKQVLAGLFQGQNRALLPYKGLFWHTCRCSSRGRTRASSSSSASTFTARVSISVSKALRV
jgi:hypothetical protein